LSFLQQKKSKTLLHCWFVMAALQKKDSKNRLKVVVRGLPAQLTEQTFQSSIEKFHDLVDFYYYVPGRISEKKNVNSRAYLNFKTADDLQEFGRIFDGHTFVTSKGKEQKAKVEFAPFQKTPNKVKKRGPDAREGTIETDPDYLKFIESLNETVKPLPSAEEQLDKRLAEQKELEANGQTFLTTPLLEYLKQKRAQKLKRGDRAERRKRAKERDRVGKEITGIAVNPNKPKVVSEDKKVPRKEKSTSRRREREERRKKKEKGDEAVPRPESPTTKKDVIAKSEEEAKRKNGLWQIKKAQEPGLIAIQPRDINGGSTEQFVPTTSVPGIVQPTSQQRTPRLKATSNNLNPNLGGAVPRKTGPRRGGGGGRGEMKIYAPKQATPVAAKNGP